LQVLLSCVGRTETQFVGDFRSGRWEAGFLDGIAYQRKDLFLAGGQFDHDYSPAKRLFLYTGCIFIQHWAKGKHNLGCFPSVLADNYLMTLSFLYLPGIVAGFPLPALVLTPRWAI
jgi:hypothetical protein